MNSLPIIALIGMAVLVTATVGFGQTLTTSPDFNLIGASDNNAVPSARANITELVWTEAVSALGAIEATAIVFTIGNEDIVNHHDYSVCSVIEVQDGTFLPTAGSAPDCMTTGDIGPSLNGTSNTITFGTAMNVTDIVDISFSIEEIE